MRNRSSSSSFLRQFLDVGAVEEILQQTDLSTDVRAEADLRLANSGDASVRSLLDYMQVSQTAGFARLEDHITTLREGISREVERQLAPIHETLLVAATPPLLWRHLQRGGGGAGGPREDGEPPVNEEDENIQSRIYRFIKKHKAIRTKTFYVENSTARFRYTTKNLQEPSPSLILKYLKKCLKEKVSTFPCRVQIQLGLLLRHKTLPPLRLWFFAPSVNTTVGSFPTYYVHNRLQLEYIFQDLLRDNYLERNRLYSHELDSEWLFVGFVCIDYVFYY